MNRQHFPRIQFDQIQTHKHQLADGRKLAYATYGRPNGMPVYYFHGCPGSRYETAPSQEAAN